MSEIDPNIAEKTDKTKVVSYEEWHPPEGNELWQRLEIPGQTRNGSYTDPVRFNEKAFWNADVSAHISHHDRLNHWNQQLSVAFVTEHYLQQSRLGAPSPRVLEVGTWPMRNPTVATQFDNTVIGVLSQNKHMKVVGVDKVDLATAFPYQSYTPPNFGVAEFINGDFNSDETQQRIIASLGNKPDVIIGNMVFEQRLGNWDEKYSAVGQARIWAKTATDIPTKPEMAEKLALTANDFLKSDGILIVCNRGYGQIPEFIHKMPLLAVYMDQTGKLPFAQVRGKI